MEWLAQSFLATTSPVRGIAGPVLPLEAVIGGLLLVALPYGVAVIVAARRGALRTGRDAIGSRAGPRTSTTSVRAALSWLAEAPECRSIVVTGPAARSAAVEPSGGVVILTGFDGARGVRPRDVTRTISNARTRALFAAELELLVGGISAPTVSTFERFGGD